MRVYKYKLDPLAPYTTVQMPMGAEVLDFREQPPGSVGSTEGYYIWALVDDTVAHEHRYFTIVPTGYEMPTRFRGAPVSLKYIGASHCLLPAGNFVLHCFEIIEARPPAESYPDDLQVQTARDC